jgi:hypothetical protein
MGMWGVCDGNEEVGLVDELLFRKGTRSSSALDHGFKRLGLFNARSARVPQSLEAWGR